MKIALIPGAFFPSPGGAQVQVHNLANKLIDNKAEVDCYLFDKTNLTNNKYKIFILNRFILSITFLLKYYFNFEFLYFLKLYLSKIIKLNDYDLWHFNFLNYKSLLLIKILKKLNQKIIVTFQGVDIQINTEIIYGYRLDKKYDQFLKEIIFEVDKFTCLSETIKKDLKKIKINEEKLILIPNAVDLNKFENFKSNSKDKNKIFRLITVARYSPKKKGFDLLPRLSKILIDSKIKFQWTILGKNTSELSQYEIIKKNSSYFKILDDVTNFKDEYLPSKELIMEYMESDLYVNLSRIESFGITFVEALAAGIPIISFDTKGANEIIINNHNGFILKEEEIDKIGEKIKEIYSKPKLIEKLKVGINETALKYDLNLVTKKFLNTYNLVNKSN